MSGEAPVDDIGLPPPFPYDGPASLREPVVRALSRVIDPEVALSIVDVGLVYGVTVAPRSAQVRMTMTSAACPVADVIVDDVALELERVLPGDCELDVELCWEPAWTPECMSERGRLLMGW